jgi:hypothetical protein
MQARTQFRLAMLANGYQPLLNDCKRSIEKGWPTTIVDKAEVRSWDRSALASTGLKLDGDLAVIDADVADASLVAALADALDERFPELFTHGLVRHAGGPKEAWIARVDEPFRRLASRRWYCGSDPDDPAMPKHMVECFGSLGTRQFAIDGPHSRNQRAKSSVPTISPAAPPRRRSRVRPCRCCRKWPTRKPAICSTRSRRPRGSRPSRPRRGAGAGRGLNVLNSMQTPRSKRKTTA